MPVLITGPPRSGTSLVAELVARAGVDLGARLPRKSERRFRSRDGSYRHFEDPAFQKLSSLLMWTAEGTWRDPPSTDRLAQAAEFYAHRIRSEIWRRERAGEPWGWKDPQLVHTAIAFHPLLSAPRYILVKRDFDAIVDSKQVDLPVMRRELIETAIRLTLERIEALIAWLPGEVPVLHVRFEDLVNRNEDLVRELIGFAGGRYSRKLLRIIEP